VGWFYVFQQRDHREKKIGTGYEGSGRICRIDLTTFSLKSFKKTWKKSG